MREAYPRGLFLGSIVNAGNMAGLGMLNSLLVLYCIHGLFLPTQVAYTIYAAFGALFYSAALLGGFLGGRYDYKLAVIIGCALAGIGGYFLVFNGIFALFIGLACFTVGCSLITPNLYCILGNLYAKTDPHRDSGFTVIYTITNIGAMLSSFSSGFIVNYFGYHAAFFFSSTIVLLSLFLFIAGYHRFDFFQDENTKPYQAIFSFKKLFILLFAVLITIPVVTILLHYAKFNNFLLLVIGAIMFFVVLALAFQQPLKTARTKMLLFLIFITVGVLFWSLYMLMPSALTIFIERNVNRQVGTWLIPAGSFYGLNPFVIILFGPLVSMGLVWLTRHRIQLTLPLKFSIGIIAMALGYLVLFVGIYFSGKNGLTAVAFVILSYFLQSFGELFIGPTSFAMVGALCPTSLEGLMMGFFRFSVGASGALSGFLASATIIQHDITNPLVTNHQFSHTFGLYGLITITFGFIIFLFVPFWNKLQK